MVVGMGVRVGTWVLLLGSFVVVMVGAAECVGAALGDTVGVVPSAASTTAPPAIVSV